LRGGGTTQRFSLIVKFLFPKNPLLVILNSLILAGFFCFTVFAFASYNPGQTLDPACNPTDSNCVVISPITRVGSSTLDIGTGGTLGTAAYTNSTAYEVPLTFGTGFARATNTITNNLLTGILGGQKIIGGTDVGDLLSLQGTTGNGTLTSPAINFLVGNNGGTNAMTILNNGNVGIGTTSPTSSLSVNGTISSSQLVIENPSLIDSNSFNIAAWGDSITQAKGGATPYTAYLNGYLGGRNIYNYGVSGYTSTQIATAFLASTTTLNYTAIIWSGFNDVNNPATVESNIATMVAAITANPKRFLVLSIINGSNEPRGSANYNNILSINNYLAATYGNQYLDVRSYLISSCNPPGPTNTTGWYANSAQDITDCGNDEVPTSLRQDYIHLTSDGNNIVAKDIASNFNAADGVQYALSPKTLINLFSSPFPIGTYAPNTGLFTKLGIGLATSTTPLSFFAPLSVEGAETTPNIIDDVIHVLSNSAGTGSGSSISFGSAMVPTWAMASIGAYFPGAPDNSGNLVFSTNGSGTPTGLTEKMRIDFAGQVGIGTTKLNNGSYAKALTIGVPASNGNQAAVEINSYNISNNTPGSVLAFDNADAEVAKINTQIFGSGSFYTADLVFSNALSGTMSEKMRITSGGDLGVGTATPSNILHVTGTPASGTAVAQIANTLGGTTQNNGLLILAGNDGGENASQLITFKRHDGTVIGSISQNAAATIAYNLSSDQRIKENIVPTTYGLSDLMKINVDDFNYTSDVNKQKTTGFIAQNLYTIFPGAVTTNGDDGITTLATNATPWMVDYSKVTPLIVKAIQDMNLNLEGISGTVTPTAGSTSETFVTAFFNNIKTKINTWLADATNGIAKIFVGEVDTGKLCVKKSDGNNVCVTGDQLNSLLSGTANSGSATLGNTGGGNSNTSLNCKSPQILNAKGDACVDPAPSTDTTPPVITLNGEATMTLNVGDIYTEPGTISTDNSGEAINVVVTGTVDTATAGTYTINYNATDSAGNKATELTRTVTVNAAQ